MQGEFDPNASQSSAAESIESLPAPQMTEHGLDHTLASPIPTTVFFMTQLIAQGVFRGVDGVAFDFLPGLAAGATRLEWAVATGEGAIDGVGRRRGVAPILPAPC
jgi:hypothetical protein